jgi:hypothetical protein
MLAYIYFKAAFSKHSFPHLKYPIKIALSLGSWGLPACCYAVTGRELDDHSPCLSKRREAAEFWFLIYKGLVP